MFGEIESSECNRRTGGGWRWRWRGKHRVEVKAMVLGSMLVSVLALVRWFDGIGYPRVQLHKYEYGQFERCSVQNMLNYGFAAIPKAEPIQRVEYNERRRRLAQALVSDGVDAFIVEPGYTFKYYANISQPDWEPWEPEERPFLMIVQPCQDGSGQVNANTTFLVPKFEAERVRLLGMPFEDRLQIVTWEEHWDPYQTLANANLFSQHPPNVMVDEEMRDFIQRGLLSAGFRTHGLTGAVEAVRQTKSASEIDILKAVNTGTVEAIRQMRKCLVPGLTENEVQRALDGTLRAAGMDPFFDIVLFDEDASNPHGGTDGSKLLEEDTFVLIDVGAHLYGYSSDVCRTFLPPFAHNCAGTRKRLQKKLHIWDIVYEAQTASIQQFRENNTAASVDIAARRVIAEAGYAEAFTHRVGHGIGIKAHESPYLNKGNTATVLRAGMTFTTEPGIYLVDEFGVRHEDIFLITADAAECLSCPRALDAWNP